MRLGGALLRREYRGDGGVCQKDERRALRHDTNVGAGDRVLCDCRVLAVYKNRRRADRTHALFVEYQTRVGIVGVGSGVEHPLLADTNERDEIHRRVGGGGNYALLGGGNGRFVGDFGHG